MRDTSVIITNYNKGKFIGRCLRSILNQSLKRDKFEIIVVDDKSTDESRIIIDSFRDEIIPIYLEKNLGVAGASNEGIKKARGNFIIRVDADDYISEHALLFLTEIMTENKDIGFAYCDHILVDEKGRYLKRVEIDNLEKLFKRGAGIMFRKSNLEAVGLYDTKLKRVNDPDLLLKYLKNFDGYHLKMPLYRYCRHAENISKNISERKEYKVKVEKRYKLKALKL